MFDSNMFQIRNHILLSCRFCSGTRSVCCDLILSLKIVNCNVIVHHSSHEINFCRRFPPFRSLRRRTLCDLLPGFILREVLVAEEYADIKKCAICLASSDIFHVQRF